MPTERPWAVLIVNGEAHLLPVYDTFEHEAWDCWCLPVVKIYADGDGDPIVTHIHSADDAREFDEMANAAETTTYH